MIYKQKSYKYLLLHSFIISLFKVVYTTILQYYNTTSSKLYLRIGHQVVNMFIEEDEEADE